MNKLQLLNGFIKENPIAVNCIVMARTESINYIKL